MFSNYLTSLLLLPLVCNFIQVIVLKIDITLPVLNMDRGDGWGWGRVCHLSKVTRYVHVVKKKKKNIYNFICV